MRKSIQTCIHRLGRQCHPLACGCPQLHSNTALPFHSINDSDEKWKWTKSKRKRKRKRERERERERERGERRERREPITYPLTHLILLDLRSLNVMCRYQFTILISYFMLRTKVTEQSAQGTVVVCKNKQDVVLVAVVIPLLQLAQGSIVCHQNGNELRQVVPIDIPSVWLHLLSPLQDSNHNKIPRKPFLLVIIGWGTLKESQKMEWGERWGVEWVSHSGMGVS